MILHKKSRAIFEETPIDGYYILEGINMEGKFRIDMSFIDDFEVIYSDVDYSKVELDRNGIRAWRRYLIYYIGETLRIQKNRKKGLAKARQAKAENIGGQEYHDLELKGRKVLNLDKNLNLDVKKIEEYTFSSLRFDENVNIDKVCKDLSDILREKGYGELVLWGYFKNLDTQPFFFNYSNGTQVRLIMDRRFLKQEEAKPLPKLKQPKRSNEDKQNERKATARKVAAKELGADPDDIVDLKYLEAHLNMPATKIRAKLRSFMSKPEGGWVFTKKQADEIIKKISNI